MTKSKVRLLAGARFLAILLLGLGLLAVLGYLALNRVTAEWFEKDLRLRSELAVAAARQGLAEAWYTDSTRLALTLEDMARDERIVAAAACGQHGEEFARTAHYPDVFSCADVLARMRREQTPDTHSWSMIAELPVGKMQISATTVDRLLPARGFVVLVQDLGFWLRREETTRRLSLLGFFVLALCAAGVTVLAAKAAKRTWTDQLRAALTGQPDREFQPLVSDLRELASRLVAEEKHEAATGAWSPSRLKAALQQYLQGERVVVLANRAPYMHNQVANRVQVIRPASGLVTALEPVLRACSGVWVAHGSGSADRATVDAHDRVAVPPNERSYWLRRVWLSEEEEQGYYYGFANEGLWPLCHIAHARPLFRNQDYEHYRNVNRKFADAVCQEVDSTDPIVLVQDYHFALAPQMIRERLPRATILTFWHIPWPNAERFGICPWRDELIAGLLGSSIIGFHTQQHCNNFIESLDKFVECRIDRETHAVQHKGHSSLIRPYPISIEWPVHALEAVPPVAQCRSEVRRELGLSDGVALGVGVDRLDYTKGIEERFWAIDQLLERYPEHRGRFVFAQLSAPSRTKIERYRELNQRVATIAETINQRWGTGAYRPIVLLLAHHEASEVYRYYRAADLCYVSSLHDGMNLVAKEFVAARDDEQGVLVLSQFTGAARELTEALIVNPYDAHQSSDALAAALRMQPDEQRDRMRSMRRLVAQFNVYRWAGRMLMDAAELRRRERLAGRLSAIWTPRDAKIVHLKRPGGTLG